MKKPPPLYKYTQNVNTHNSRAIFVADMPFAGRLIIMNGRNTYPGDLEIYVNEDHPGLKEGLYRFFNSAGRGRAMPDG